MAMTDLDQALTPEVLQRLQARKLAQMQGVETKPYQFDPQPNPVPIDENTPPSMRGPGIGTGPSRFPAPAAVAGGPQPGLAGRGAIPPPDVAQAPAAPPAAAMMPAAPAGPPGGAMPMQMPAPYPPAPPAPAAQAGGTAAPILDPNSPLQPQQDAMNRYLIGVAGAGEPERRGKDYRRMAQIMRDMGQNNRMDWASQASRAIGGIASGYGEKKARGQRDEMEKVLGDLRGKYLREMGMGEKEKSPVWMGL